MNLWNQFRNRALYGVRQFTKSSKNVWNSFDFKGMSLQASRDTYQLVSKTRPYIWAKWGLIGSTAGHLCYVYGTRFEKNILVTRSFNRLRETRGGDVENEYLIADENQRLYQVVTSLWYWQWFPDELWSGIKEDKHYKIKGYGIRIRRLGIHPRLIRAELID